MALGDPISHAITLSDRLYQAAPPGTTLTAYLNRSAHAGSDGSSLAAVDSAAVDANGVVTFDPVIEGERYFVAKTVPKVVNLAVAATAGNYTLTYRGETTANIAFNADPTSGGASVRALLETLNAIGAGDVTVTGGPGDADGSPPYVVTFTGALAGENDELTAADVNLSGGAATVTVTGVTAGAKNAVLFRFRAGTLPGAAPSSHPVARRASGVYAPGV